MFIKFINDLKTIIIFILIEDLINIDIWELALEVIGIKKDNNFKCPVCDEK